MVKKKVQQLTQEELKQQNLERELRDLRDRLFLISEPTYRFNIGDRVAIGNLKEVHVVAVLEDGKIYEIDYTSVNNNYGNPIEYKNQRMYIPWTEIRKFQEGNSESLVQNKDLVLNYSQRNLRDILSKSYHFGVNFEPDYQRGYVWELEDKVSLIDSIFHNVDIGKFVFIRKGYGEKYLYEVLDGKQRARAILDYYEDRFQYKGKYFSDLSPRDQSHFEDYNVSIAEVDNLNKEQTLRYFIKLNTCGKTMSQEHINKVKEMLGS